MGKRKQGEEKPKMEGEYDLPAKAMKAVHVEGNKKRLIVVLHGAQLETVKASKSQKTKEFLVMFSFFRSVIHLSCLTAMIICKY